MSHKEIRMVYRAQNLNIKLFTSDKEEAATRMNFHTPADSEDLRFRLIVRLRLSLEAKS